MHARVTSVEIDTIRVGAEEVLRQYQGRVVPRLREQEGYRGVIGLLTPEGKGLVITFWESEEEATESRATGFYDEVVSQFVTMFSAPPGRDHYEVVLADVPSLTIDGG